MAKNVNVLGFSVSCTEMNALIWKKTMNVIQIPKDN